MREEVRVYTTAVGEGELLVANLRASFHLQAFQFRHFKLTVHPLNTSALAGSPSLSQPRALLQNGCEAAPGGLDGVLEFVKSQRLPIVNPKVVASKLVLRFL